MSDVVYTKKNPELSLVSLDFSNFSAPVVNWNLDMKSSNAGNRLFITFFGVPKYNGKTLLLGSVIGIKFGDQELKLVLTEFDINHNNNGKITSTCLFDNLGFYLNTIIPGGISGQEGYSVRQFIKDVVSKIEGNQVKVAPDIADIKFPVDLKIRGDQDVFKYLDKASDLDGARAFKYFVDVFGYFRAYFSGEATNERAPINMDIKNMSGYISGINWNNIYTKQNKKSFQKIDFEKTGNDKGTSVAVIDQIAKNGEPVAVRRITTLNPPTGDAGGMDEEVLKKVYFPTLTVNIDLYGYSNFILPHTKINLTGFPYYNLDYLVSSVVISGDSSGNVTTSIAAETSQSICGVI